MLQMTTVTELKRPICLYVLKPNQTPTGVFSQATNSFGEMAPLRVIGELLSPMASEGMSYRGPGDPGLWIGSWSLLTGQC